MDAIDEDIQKLVQDAQQTGSITIAEDEVVPFAASSSSAAVDPVASRGSAVVQPSRSVSAHAADGDEVLTEADVPTQSTVQEEINAISAESLPTPPSVSNMMNNIDDQDLLATLQKRKNLSEDQVAELRLEQVNSGKKVAELLTEKQWVSQIDIDQAAAEMNGIPYIFLNEVAISPEAMAFIPQSVAENYNVLAFDYDPTANALSVAMADAMDLVAIEFIEKKTRTTLKPHATNHADLMRVIRERYGVSLSSEVKQVLKDTDLGKGSGLQQAQVTQVGGVIREAPIAKIVSYVLEYAIKTRASDVHIEPLEERTRVRYRIDGILQEKLVLPRKIHGALVSRIKILSDMKIDEKRLPQDGRFAFEALQQAVDLRVSTLPTAHGEKVVMRLLKKTGGAVSLTELGMRGRALQNFNEVIIKPNGIVLVTGPTGSGKTTTLYSVLTKLNTSKVNIITLEDPIEYEIQGVNQVQVHETVGLTFASGLRSFLRQDPNIIMVGEIRDSETADLAIQAALTGHLVFSTLHTNSAAGSLPRLLDMGGEPFLLASTIGCVVGQRVARKVCPACQATFEPPVEVLADIKQVLGSLYPEGPVNLYKGKGCQECGNTGYQGMIGVFEVLMVTEKIGKLILERQPANEVEKVAIANGMVTMKQDGYLKVLEGLTTIEEVLRVAED